VEKKDAVWKKKGCYLRLFYIAFHGETGEEGESWLKRRRGRARGASVWSFFGKKEEKGQMGDWNKGGKMGGKPRSLKRRLKRKRAGARRI